MNNNDTIIILDFGSQYNQLIVRRIRELGVYAELWPHNCNIQDLQQAHIKGVVLSGGPQSITDADSMRPLDNFWNISKPILGICYGMQLMMHTLGGEVSKAQKAEYGEAILESKDSTDALLSKIATESVIWMSHQDDTKKVPQGWNVIGSTSNCDIAAVANKEMQMWGIQFHPEVSHSKDGMQILENFCFSICKAQATWSIKNYIHILEEEIRSTVGDEQVVCGLSGGVDSAVVATLLNRVIGTQLHCVYVDHGLMRAGESEEVVEIFGKMLGTQFHMVDASEQFFKALKGVSEPEKKRKIIGHEFIEVFNNETKRIKNISFLAQGTLYTDIVESGHGGKSHTIKSHHNVGGLPKDMKLKLVEPLKKLFKDEVRMLGKELGLPDSMIHRQPFPGPGLAIRVLGEVSPEKVRIVQNADKILREEINKAGLDREIWQYFAALPGIQTVGVQGDQRTYSHAIIIRAICSIDGMTANVAELPYSVIRKISRRITNEVSEVNRVLFDVTDKPPGTIELE